MGVRGNQPLPCREVQELPLSIDGSRPGANAPMDVLCRQRREPALLTLFRNRVFFPPEQRSATLADQAEEALRTKLTILERQLIKTPYFGGDRWDMTDFMVRGRAICSHPPEIGSRGLPKTRRLVNRKHQPTSGPSGAQITRSLRQSVQRGRGMCDVRFTPKADKRFGWLAMTGKDNQP